MTAMPSLGTPLAVEAQAATTRYEAESAPAVCDGVVASNHSGYSGSGFCDTTNAVGSAAQFTINSAAAGTATVSVRYGNGSTENRPADIAVNGTMVQPGYAFEATGAWTTWATKLVTVGLAAGTNTVRLGRHHLRRARPTSTSSRRSHRTAAGTARSSSGAPLRV